MVSKFHNYCFTIEIKTIKIIIMILDFRNNNKIAQWNKNYTN